MTYHAGCTQDFQHDCFFFFRVYLVYKICSKKVEWAIEFPSKYHEGHFISEASFEAAAVWYTKNRSCTKRVHQVSLLLPLSSISDWLSLSVLGSVPTHFPSFYPFFRPFSLHIDPHWESKPHVTLSKCFLNVFGTPFTSIKSYPKTIRNPPDPLSKWDGRPVIIIASQEPEKQLLLYTVDVLPEKVRVVRIKKKKGGFYLMIDVGSH